MNNVIIWGFADPISSWSHLLSAFAALVGAFFLVKKGKGNGWRIFSLIVYSFTLVFLFSMSGVFHLLERGSEARAVLQRLDHAGIWCLIAGTFTPIHSILFRGIWRWLVLLFVWSVAITGLVLQVVFFKSFPEWLALSFFLGLGWVGFVSHFRFKKTYPGHSALLIVLGGLSYSVGAIMDFIRWPIIWYQYIGPHEVFHFFVTLGALFHWIFSYNWCNHPISDEFICDIKQYADGTCILHGHNDSLSIQDTSLDNIKTRALKIIKTKYHHQLKYQVVFKTYEVVRSSD